MSAKPFSFKLPLQPNPYRSNSYAASRSIRFACAVWPTHSQRARRTLCFASASNFPCSRREPATVTERAMRPALPQGLRNSRFRFEVPARIACPGGKWRRPRCDPILGCASKPAAQPAARLRFPVKPGKNQALDSLMRISQFFCTSKFCGEIHFRRCKHRHLSPPNSPNQHRNPARLRD
jgi:hypothetical protein